MARSPSPTARPHFVVDGSNIATEGRALPSLQQLNDAVLAFIEEHPDALITVVVDATFGHRIDSKEVNAFDEAVANNELVTPPAGAVGRGDAFVLTIAHKAKAGILSNDSFQEFHGEYAWLFDPGRLIGGKPVPHVGWVFVERLPVRGPRSRQSVKDAKGKGVPAGRAAAARGSGSPLADQPMPVPTAPPPGKLAPAKSRRGTDSAAAASTPPASATVKPAGGGSVNDLLPFLEFVERHPVGTSCTVVIESYASHGAYARSGDVLVYLPLRLMGNPVPRSARAAVSIGDAIAVVIAGYVPERRSIDAALPSATDVLTPPPPAPAKRSRKRGAQPDSEAAAITAAAIAAAAVAGETGELPPLETSPAGPAPAKPRATRSRAAKPAPAAAVAPQSEPDSAPAAPAKRGRKRVATPVAPAAVEAPPAKPARSAKTVSKSSTKKAAPAKRASKPSAAKRVSEPAPVAAPPDTAGKPAKRTRAAKKSVSRKQSS